MYATPSSLVVPIGWPSEVSNPAINPSTSSRVSTTSRSSRPTSRVSTSPRDGGVCMSRTRAPTAEARRRSNYSKVNVSGPAAATPRGTLPAMAQAKAKRHTTPLKDIARLRRILDHVNQAAAEAAGIRL